MLDELFEETQSTYLDETINLCDICMLHIDSTEYKFNKGICDDCKFELEMIQKESEYESE